MTFVDGEILYGAQLNALAATAAAGGTFTQAGTGAVARTMQAKVQELVSVKDFGAAGDGVTDDTAALQAWINYCKGSGVRGFHRAAYLPTGSYRHTGLTIDRPITIYGDGQMASTLDLIPGGSVPAITVAVAFDISSYLFSWGDGIVTLRDIAIGGTKTDATGITNGIDGIRLVYPGTNPLRSFVFLQGVKIFSMPRSAIFAASAQGAIIARDCFFFNCGQDLLSANTCNDWQFTNCLFGTATRNAVRLSGCSQFIFDVCNFYSSGAENIYLFASDASGMIRFKACSSDRAGTHGVFYDYRGGGHVEFEGCYWNGNSATTSGASSDIYVSGAVVGGPIINGCWFQATNAQNAAKKTKYNVEFAGGTSTVYVCGGTEFDGGDSRTTGTTNAPLQILGAEIPQEGSGTDAAGGDVTLNAGRGTGAGAGGGVRIRSTRAGSTGSTANSLADLAKFTPNGGLSVYANTQFTGIGLYHSDGTLAALLKGASASNKSGVLQLMASDGSTVHTQFAAAGSGFAVKVTFPGPYANDAAAAAASPSVAIGEAYRVTGGNVAWRVS